ncbi:MAG: FtsX-like permease family protein [Acidobacteriales bacterium]|nr:FtsX-like permease family protein [Terriglobales bacterium]
MLDGTPNTIIGVLPPEFHFAPAEPADFWSTMLAGNRECRYCHGLYGIARLKDDVSFSAAFANIAAIARQLEQQYPDTNHDQAAYMLPLTDVIVGDIRPILLVVFSGAVLLLLIAGVNVTSLLLVRAEGRKREIAVRGALGASPARIMRQLVTEGLVLAMIGSVFGLVTALWASKLLIRLVPKDRMASMPFLHGAGLTSDVVIFVLAISFLAGLLVSLIPALRLPFSQGLEVLQEGGRTSAGTVWRKLGAKLVVVELASAVLLLVCHASDRSTAVHLLQARKSHCAGARLDGPRRSSARSQGGQYHQQIAFGRCGFHNAICGRGSARQPRDKRSDVPASQRKLFFYAAGAASRRTLFRGV